MMDMSREVLPMVKDTAVLAGVCGTDPFRQMPVFLREVRDLGFAGVQNFPTVGIYDGTFRQNLEETGMGFQREVEMIHTAHELDLLTTPYAFNAAEARDMAEAGADIVVAHMGLTTSGTIGAQTAMNLDEAVDRVTEIKESAKSVRDDVIVLCHGGPIAMPEDAQYVLSHTSDVDGFYGASSMERLPTETAMTAAIKKFKQVTV